MSNKSQLQLNNTELISLIETLSNKAIAEPVTPVAQATPSISVSSSGLITATVIQDAGYVVAGTKSATKQLTTQSAKIITPSTSSQTAVAKDRYTTGAVTVAAIPSTYVKPTTKKSATTYTPTTSNQTIAAGTYCSGAQTIKGDANLKAENIAEGVSIFGVTGTHSGGSSGGGGNIETCTVTVTIDSKFTMYGVHYTTFVNGKITNAYKTSVSSLDDGVVMNNVVCNSAISINANVSSSIPGFTINGTARFETYLNGYHIYYFKAPSVSGENCSIYMYDDD